jgi:NADH-quinone oxidoreductase subunit L
MVMEYAWLIPALPLAAFVLVTLLGSYMPERGGYLSAASIVAAGGLAVYTAWEAWGLLAESFRPEHGHHGEPFHWTLQENVGHAWLEAGNYVFDLGLYLDSISAWLLGAVGILTAGIAVYSIGYIRPETDGYHLDDGTHVHVDGRQRYYAALALFVASMLGFVVGSNLLQMFVFWELMGLCSYLLIGFWYAKPSAAQAAKKAFLVTRVGDVFFLGGLVTLAVLFGDAVSGSALALELETLLDAGTIETVAAEHSTALGLAVLGLFLGAVGKSAQLPLHVWLPDAMEGPTTVSALIHAATMVKAGVFLVARFFPLFDAVTWVLYVVAVVGALTAFVAATMAVMNYDIKRVLAFSTISQLGYMFLGLGVAVAIPGGFAAGLFHLMNHAFFKALLFLCAGAVGFALHNYDMRDFGGLAGAMPITAGTMLFATLAISGIPPFSGFFSKDELLAETFAAGSEHVLFYGLWALALVTAGLTAYYMFRLWFMTFLGDYRGDHEEELDDGTGHMNLVLLVFAVFTLVTGFAVFFAADNLAYHHALEVTLAKLLGWKTFLSLGVALAGVALAWTRWGPDAVEDSMTPHGQEQGLERVVIDRYYVTEAYYKATDALVLGLARLSDAVDTHVVDWSVDAIGRAHDRVGGFGSRLQTGRVSDYATWILSGLLVFVVIVVYILRYTLGRGL